MSKGKDIKESKKKSKTNRSSWKATSQMNDLVNKAAEKTIQTANNLILKLFGPAAEGLGLIMAQGIRQRLLDNQLRGLKKLLEKCKAEKISIKQLNLKVLFPYLEGIAVEEEFDLEEVWANLMANYLDSNKNLEVVVYPGILKQLSTNDIKALKYIYELRGTFMIVDGKLRQIGEESSNSRVTATFQMSNLQRLGLLEQLQSGARPAHGLTLPKPSLLYNVSSFGKEFYEACQR